jgi:hypothetical protein
MRPTTHHTPRRHEPLERLISEVHQDLDDRLKGDVAMVKLPVSKRLGREDQQRGERLSLRAEPCPGRVTLGGVPAREK